MVYNVALHNQLPVIGKESTDLKCYLINMDNQDQRWEFLIPPQVIQYDADNSFTTSYALFGKKPNTRYARSSVGSIRISDLILTTPGHSRSIRPLMTSLDQLRFPQTADDLYPPKLSLVYGARPIQPLYLASVSFEETEHLNGEPTMLTVSMSFIGAEQIQF